MVLAVGLVVLWVVLCVRLVRWQAGLAERDGAARPRAADRPARASARGRVPRQRELPVGHRPPPGLSPLSPSERFLSQESARGVREMQTWLAEQASA